MDTGFQCAGCGEWNEIVIDPSAGSNQSYIEDCQVCCKPNILRISFQTESSNPLIASESE